MPVYRDEAIVLRVQKLGEADRIVTLLTRGHGRVRGVARGVRKTSSRIGARLEPFGHVDVQLYEGRSLDTVTQVESIAAARGVAVIGLPALDGRYGHAGDGRAAHPRGAGALSRSSRC